MSILCWWKHKWVFVEGRWVIPGKLAITKRQCVRCWLYEEISQDHVNNMRFLDERLFLDKRITPDDAEFLRSHNRTRTSESGGDSKDR